MLPSLIGDKIKNPSENETWQLVLQPGEIVELICAPAISADQIAYLQVIINEYLHTRWNLFPITCLNQNTITSVTILT